MTSTPIRALCVLCLAIAAAQAEPITVVSGVFTVDRTPPTVPVALTPATVTAPFLRLQASSADAVSGVAGYDFELTNVGTAQGAADYAVFRGLGNGIYAWSVRARDAAGNWSDWAAYDCAFADGDDSDIDGLPDAWELVEALLTATDNQVHALRDPTRGGLATTLCELAEDAGLGVALGPLCWDLAVANRGAFIPDDTKGLAMASGVSLAF